MRVMDGDLAVPTCLRTPMLILPARCFVQLYYDPDAQGQYASDFPTRGQGFLQPRGDIRTSIVGRNFRILPDDVREVIDLYFHKEGLEAKENQESNDCMSTNTEAANTVRCLQLHCPAAMASLQMAVREALMPATATRPQEEEYQYDSDDSDRGRLRTRVDCQSELDRACSKSRKRSKSRRRSKSRKRSKSRRSKSRKRDGAGSKINTNPIDQEFGCHSVNERCLISPRAGPLKRTRETSGTRCSQMTCPNSGS